MAVQKLKPGTSKLAGVTIVFLLINVMIFETMYMAGKQAGDVTC